jgi:hypothetical protein
MEPFLKEAVFTDRFPKEFHAMLGRWERKY